METSVSVIDLALARILLNFAAACVMVYCAGKHVTKDVPGNFKCALSYRSVMILVDQILNVYAISILSLGVVTILQNTQAFWTAILAYYFNGESFYAVEAIGIVACFFGVILIGIAEG